MIIIIRCITRIRCFLLCTAMHRGEMSHGSKKRRKGRSLYHSNRANELMRKLFILVRYFKIDFTGNLGNLVAQIPSWFLSRNFVCFWAAQKRCAVVNLDNHLSDFSFFVVIRTIYQCLRKHLAKAEHAINLPPYRSVYMQAWHLLP